MQLACNGLCPASPETEDLKTEDERLEVGRGCVWGGGEVRHPAAGTAELRGAGARGVNRRKLGAFLRSCAGLEPPPPFAEGRCGEVWASGVRRTERLGQPNYGVLGLGASVDESWVRSFGHARGWNPRLLLLRGGLGWQGRYRPSATWARVVRLSDAVSFCWRGCLRYRSSTSAVRCRRGRSR